MSVEGRRFRKTTLALDGIRPQLVHGESKVLFTPLPANESLQHALNLAQEAYTTQNPQSYQAHQDASLVLANSAPRRVRNTSYLPFPLSHGLKEGECVTLDGQSYIDLADEEHDAFFRLSQRDMLASVIDNGNVKGRKSSESELAKMVSESQTLYLAESNSSYPANSTAY